MIAGIFLDLPKIQNYVSTTEITFVGNIREMTENHLKWPTNETTEMEFDLNIFLWKNTTKCHGCFNFGTSVRMPHVWPMLLHDREIGTCEQAKKNCVFGTLHLTTNKHEFLCKFAYKIYCHNLAFIYYFLISFAHIHKLRLKKSYCC